MLKAILVLLMLSLPAAPAYADAKSVRDAIVRELREDGYTNIRMSRTLLGRLRFVAERPGARREIVVSPSTGVILRDYLRLLQSGEGNTSKGTGLGGGGGGNGNDDENDDDEDDDDDENDDEGDDDESDEDDSDDEGGSDDEDDD